MVRRRPVGVAFGAALTVALAFLAVLVLHPWGARMGALVDDFAELVAMAGAAAICGRRASTCEGRSRRAWILLAAFAGLWTVGGGIWTWYEVFGGSVPSPSLADLAYLLAAPCAAVGLISFPSAGSATTRARGVLDGAVMASSALLVGWAVVIGPVARAGSTSTLALVVAVAFPVCDVILLAIAVNLLARVGPRRSTVLLLVAGVASITVADSFYAWISATHPAVGGEATGAGWLLGFLLLAIAAWSSTNERGDSSHGQTKAVASPAYIYGPVVLAAGVVMVELAWTHHLDVVLTWILVISWLLVVARQWLSTLEVVERQRQLQTLAFHDGLTGLANRSLLDATIESSLDAGLPVAIILIDLDNFKDVNDSLGHAAGDRVLVEMARRLESHATAGSLVARLGGDEFAVLFTQHLPSAEATATASLLGRAMRRPIVIDGIELSVSASIGLALPRDEIASLGDLLRQADLAMYSSKNAGGDSSTIFGAALGLEPVVQRRQLSPLRPVEPVAL